LNNFKLII